MENYLIFKNTSEIFLQILIFWQSMLNTHLMSVCVWVGGCVFFQLNEVRTNIMDTNHRLMAVTAELSMKQAMTLSLQQEIKEREHQVRPLQHFISPNQSPCSSHFCLLHSYVAKVLLKTLSPEV